MRDWMAWHRAYDDPSSSLFRRLGVVQRRLHDILDGAGGRPLRLLSLCAGEGRDVIGVLAGRGGSPPVTALLVELDEELAGRAAAAVASAGLVDVEVRQADAGDPAAFADALPVDVLLLCGIFGNVDDATVRHLIDVVPDLVVPGGHVLWTRGASDPDRRPLIRSWFAAAGFEEVAFDGAPEDFGMGVARLPEARFPDGPPAPRPAVPPGRLFTFTS